MSQKKRARNDGDDEHATMGFVVHCSTSNGGSGSGVYFGPPPVDRSDASVLVNKKGVGLIACLNPPTGRTTRDGSRDTSMWYHWLFRDYGTDIISVPVDEAKLIALNEAAQVNAYLEAARKIQTRMTSIRQGAAAVYIHHKNGFKHEAVVAMALWKLVSPKTATVDPVKWMEKNHPQVLRFADEKQIMRKVWERAETLSGGLNLWIRRARKSTGAK